MFAGVNTSHPAEPVRTMLLEAMTWATAPEAYAVLRDIARDPDVYLEVTELYDAAGRLEATRTHDGFSLDFRRDAARAMLAYRINGGMG